MRSNRLLATTLLVSAMGFALSAQAGNGAPSGAHYNLNILGKTTCSGDDLTGSNRHSIQVLLNGGQRRDDLNGITAAGIDKTNKIYLDLTPDAAYGFAVLDGNACDGDGALFQLPAPGAYEIFARALGKPDGAADITTCATGAGDDLILGNADDEIVCSTDSVLLVRTKGKQTFENVTTKLTTINIDTDADGVGDTVVNIFDPSLYDYFWNYENRGLRLAQLRFYPI